MQNTNRNSQNGNSSTGGTSARPVKQPSSTAPNLVMQPPSPREEEFVNLRSGGAVPGKKMSSVSDESEGVQACAKMLNIMGLAEADAAGLKRAAAEAAEMTTEMLLVHQDMQRKPAEANNISSHQKKKNECGASGIKTDDEPVTFSGEKNGSVPNIPKLMTLLHKMAGKEGQLDISVAAAKSKDLGLDFEDLQELALALGDNSHALSLNPHNNASVNSRLLSDPAFLAAFEAAGESLEFRFQSEMQGSNPRADSALTQRLWRQLDDEQGMRKNFSEGQHQQDKEDTLGLPIINDDDGRREVAAAIAAAKQQHPAKRFCAPPLEGAPSDEEDLIEEEFYDEDDEDDDDLFDLEDDDNCASCSENEIDPRFLRTYADSCPLPWNTFLRLRRSWGPIALTEEEETTVFRMIEKIPEGIGSIHDSLTFVSVFLEKHCPELRSIPGVSGPSPGGGSRKRNHDRNGYPFLAADDHNNNQPQNAKSKHLTHKNTSRSNGGGERQGATLLLLSVITGHTRLCFECLKLGANPNSCKFLTDLDAPLNQLRHGYSPTFMACICEQIEIMAMLKEYGGSIHVTDRWGRTPLHAAAAMGSVEVIDWLVSVGAPRKVVDIDMQKPGEVCEGKVISQLSTTSILFRPPPGSQSSSQSQPKKDTPSSSSPTDVPDPNDCHCKSKKPYGRCGCIDDMVDRWYQDRLTSSWSKTFQHVRDELLVTAPHTMAQVLQQEKAMRAAQAKTSQAAALVGGPGGGNQPSKGNAHQRNTTVKSGIAETPAEGPPPQQQAKAPPGVAVMNANNIQTLEKK